jgi:hypothetical protein
MPGSTSLKLQSPKNAMYQNMKFLLQCPGRRKAPPDFQNPRKFSLKQLRSLRQYSYSENISQEFSAYAEIFKYDESAIQPENEGCPYRGRHGRFSRTGMA